MRAYTKDMEWASPASEQSSLKSECKDSWSTAKFSASLIPTSLLLKLQDRSSQPSYPVRWGVQGKQRRACPPLFITYFCIYYVCTFTTCRGNILTLQQLCWVFIVNVRCEVPWAQKTVYQGFYLHVCYFFVVVVYVQNKREHLIGRSSWNFVITLPID